jgi:membrane protease YdiL (CAAX protease family)
MINWRVVGGWLLYVTLGLMLLTLVGLMGPAMRSALQDGGASPKTQVVWPPDVSSQEVTRRSAHSLEGWEAEWTLSSLKRLMVHKPWLVAALTMLTAGGLILALVDMGLGLWGLLSGRLRLLWSFTSHPLPSWSLSELARLTLLIVAMAAFVPFISVTLMVAGYEGLGDPHLRMSVSMVVVDLFAILAVCSLAGGKARSLRDTFGFLRRHLGPSLRLGLRGYVLVFPWLFVLLVAALELAKRLGWELPLEPIQELIFQEDRPLVLALTVTLACVLGPVAEELLFRGVVYPAIRRRHSWVIATLGSASLFAALHGNPVGFPSIFLLGCVLANLYERTGSLIASLAIHILHNSFLMSLALLGRQVMTAT